MDTAATHATRVPLAEHQGPSNCCRAPHCFQRATCSWGQTGSTMVGDEGTIPGDSARRIAQREVAG